MTKAYVLMAMKPQENNDLSEREKAQQLRLRRLHKIVQKEEETSGEEEEEENVAPKTQASQRSPLLKSTNGRVASYDSANGRASFQSSNGRTSFERSDSHVTFSSPNSSQEVDFSPTERGSISRSSGRGSWSVLSEDFPAFHPHTNSSTQNGLVEQNGKTYRTTLSIEDVVDLQSHDLRKRRHVVNGNATVEELNHKMGYSQIT